MKLRLLPSSFEENGTLSRKQHLACFVIDERVAIDAGSLGMAATDAHRRDLRDIVLTHAHLDHIAGLPIFLDDLFSTLTEPVRVHASPDVIGILEQDLFNWSLYPRFSELSNDHGPVLEYLPFAPDKEFNAAHLTLRAIPVNHHVPTAGFAISDGEKMIIMTGDTAALEGNWRSINELPKPDALFIECAFPDELAGLAEVSHHLTPSGLANELDKFAYSDCDIYVINIKPMFFDTVVDEISALGIPNLEVLEAGKTYEI